MENREYNQAVKADAGKLRPTLVPTQIIRDIAIVREYGNNKYGSSENWKEVEIERYRDALCRHLLAYLDDPKSVDEESGIEHYKHMACNMAFLCAMEANEFTDEFVGECETCKHIDVQPYDEPCKTCNHHEGKWNRYEPQTDVKRGCTHCSAKDNCQEAYTEKSQYCGAYEQPDCQWK